MKRLFISLALVLTLGVISLNAQTFNISGQVKTAAGAGVSGARVHLLGGDCSGEFNLTVITNPFGYWSADAPSICTSLGVAASHRQHLIPTAMVFIFVEPQTVPISGIIFTTDD